MKRVCVYSVIIILFSFFFLSFRIANENEEDNFDFPISSETEDCLMCHSTINPGIVESWKNSLHSKITVSEANKKLDLEKRISSIPSENNLTSVVVGCYECHSLNTDKHADSFDHNGYMINVIVSPDDCSVCHQEEREQYKKNIMAHAYANLMDNDVYKSLKSTITGEITFEEGNFHFNDNNKLTDADACLHCHGTKLEVKGKKIVETDFGEFEVPVIEGWPNQGVGRINPDGSKGSCTSCHPRHDFSIETARKPYTCSQCHKGPDVPAYKVYTASKHGNIFSSKEKEYNFSNVPWVIGQDFDAPTCATCHASLLTDPEGNVVVERTHQFNDRLSYRLFGVPYAHPHPISPETSKIKNSSGLQLASDLDGTPASEYLIDEQEQLKRENSMKQVCNKCHSVSWTNNHFVRLENVIKTTNSLTQTSTEIMLEIWEQHYADNANLFDEYIERQWTDVWLFHANSTRLSAAMSGGGDYGVFDNGRYQLTNKLFLLKEWLEGKRNTKNKKKKP
ncbi:MAG: hydroxylamine oxidase [Marinilabiliales bacterium]|nr:MAG: hydroxylamine oxidase [Marinilabiliales bacterium]